MALLRIDPKQIVQINCLENDGFLSCIHLFLANGESLYIGSKGNGFALGFTGEDIEDNSSKATKKMLERGICQIEEM